LNIVQLTKILQERKLSLANATNDAEKKHIFEQILRIIIKPKSQGDRTAFRNLSSWIMTKKQKNCLANLHI